MKASSEFYDAVAGQYKAYSSGYAAYLGAVEVLIAEWAGTRRTYLDIGAGDGRRSLKIAHSVSATHTTLMDNSAKMLAQAIDSSTPDSVSTVVGSIAESPLEDKFELVTCLWNVLGHIPTVVARRRALENIRSSMSEHSLFVMDVNNRYNTRQYGVTFVLANAFRDVARTPDRGVFPLNFDGCESQVYIHHPFEIDRLARSAGLKRIYKRYLNYRTGKQAATFLGGQTIYGFSKR